MNRLRHRHQMKLKRDEENPFKCSGCREIGFGPRYQCAVMNCHLVLHEVCFNAHTTDRSISHPFVVDCRFKFLRSPPVGPNPWLCHACEMDIQGFLYRGLQSSQWLYLHPFCLNLESTMSDPDGTMELILKDKLPSNSNCVKCERRDLRGWSYVSSCGNYCYHLYCMKKLILDIWESGYFHVASSSSSSRERSLVRVEKAASSSTIMSVLSDRSLIISPTSSLALPRRPWWKPQISSSTREKLIKGATICVCLIAATQLTPQNPAPLITALINAYVALKI